MTASLSRYVRSAALDVLGSDYLRTARSLGSSLPGAFVRHGVRNAAVPVISILGVELASTLLGAVVVESVFSLPGLGSMLVRAIAQHDYPSIQGVLLVTTLLVLIIGFVADVVQRVLDPRLRGPDRREGRMSAADRRGAGPGGAAAPARRGRPVTLVLGAVLLAGGRRGGPALAALAALRPRRHLRRQARGAQRGALAGHGQARPGPAQPD